MAKPGKTGLIRLIDAFGYTIKGVRQAWKSEAAFRQESVLCLMLLPAAFWLGSTALETALLIAALFFVLLVELLNSAIEALTDRFGDEFHHLAGAAKDMGSAAVFFSLLITLLVWGGVAWQRFS